MKYLIALLALAGLYVSVLALRVHNQAPGEAPPCAVTEKFDCGTVNHSRFAVFPPRSFDEDDASKKLHIPIATMGIVWYGLLAIVALTGRLWIVLEMAQIGFFFAAMLSYLEAFVIEKWCIYCLWSQGIVATILLVTGATLLVRWWSGRKAQPAPVR
ncbi:MAG: vitamin K epoxide reductase [Acidobacteriota bacterium]|nr:vitamin K epoxide reductase [Acidobacteriota bacterium]